MTRVVIPVGCIEFDDGGRTLWVQSEEGTVLRIRCTGQVKVSEGCSNNCPHADIEVRGDIEVCIPDAEAIAFPSATTGQDATGGKVESLTDAIKGVTAGLVRIADAIESLAEAVRGIK